jgi:hypothetical protein
VKRARSPPGVAVAISNTTASRWSSSLCGGVGADMHHRAMPTGVDEGGSASLLRPAIIRPILSRVGVASSTSYSQYESVVDHPSSSEYPVYSLLVQELLVNSSRVRSRARSERTDHSSSSPSIDPA